MPKGTPGEVGLHRNSMGFLSVSKMEPNLLQGACRRLGRYSQTYLQNTTFPTKYIQNTYKVLQDITNTAKNYKPHKYTYTVLQIL